MPPTVVASAQTQWRELAPKSPKCRGKSHGRKQGKCATKRTCPYRQTTLQIKRNPILSPSTGTDFFNTPGRYFERQRADISKGRSFGFSTEKIRVVMFDTQRNKSSLPCTFLVPTWVLPHVWLAG
jgi:hypothetical protein